MNPSVEILQVVERAWSEIRVLHEDVPDVIIAIGKGAQPRGQVSLGSFTPNSWAGEDKSEVHELFLGGEGLNRGATDVFGTLLHEAAHGVAQVRGVKDTSRQGRWHNERFRVIAEELGLEIEKDPKIGWSLTRVPQSTQAQYAGVIDELAGVLSVHRMQRGPKPDEKEKKPDRTALFCPGCERKIRVAKEAQEMGPVLCASHTPPLEFAPQEDEAED